MTGTRDEIQAAITDLETVTRLTGMEDLTTAKRLARRLHRIAEMKAPAPPVPAVIMLPNDRHDGYYPANVIAAIPLGHGSTYAVTAIDPVSSPDAPRFLVGEASRSIHGFWVADPDTFPVPTLGEALDALTGLAGLTGQSRGGERS